MPFLIINQSEEKLKEYLNRRISTNSEKEQHTNSFFTRSKYDSRHKLRKNKRFNTTLAQRCDVDFRIQTLYEPTDNYKFTGEHFKTKYAQARTSLELIKEPQFPNHNTLENSNDENNQYSALIHNNKPKPSCQSEKFILLKNSHNEKEIEKEKPDLFLNNEFDLTKSFLITSEQEKEFKKRCKTLKSEFKFRISHPTPVKEAEFLVNLKKDFIKRHVVNKKQKQNKQKNNLIKIEDYISERKESFKRHMETELIRSGEAKLLSQIQERKGKIYLSGLHNIGKKKKEFENIDELLRKSRSSFSTTNTLIAHLKLTSEKEKKLENIRKLKQKKMDNCLEKIKSMNIKNEMVCSFIKGK